MAGKATFTFFRLGDLQVPGNDLGVCIREDFIGPGMPVFLRPNVELILPNAKFVTGCTVSVAGAPTTRGSAHIPVQIISVGLSQNSWHLVFSQGLWMLWGPSDDNAQQYKNTDAYQSIRDRSFYWSLCYQGRSFTNTTLP